MRYFEIQFWDEAPSIGSGHRYVFAIEGRKWVQLVAPTLQTGRLTVAQWLALRPREIELTPTVRRGLRRTMRKWRRYRLRTAIVKRAEKVVAA